jgi:hypothetical protein
MTPVQSMVWDREPTAADPTGTFGPCRTDRLADRMPVTAAEHFVVTGTYQGAAAASAGKLAGPVTATSR